MSCDHWIAPLPSTHNFKILICIPRDTCNQRVLISQNWFAVAFQYLASTVSNCSTVSAVARNDGFCEFGFRHIIPNVVLKKVITPSYPWWDRQLKDTSRNNVCLIRRQQIKPSSEFNTSCGSRCEVKLCTWHSDRLHHVPEIGSVLLGRR